MTRPPPLPERSLAVVAPQVAAQLHPTRNGRLDPRAVSAGSPARVWWRCPAGHDWQTEARFRTRGSGCPFCAGRLPTADTCLAARNPVLAGQWHQTRNGVLTPTDVLPAVRARVWWQCPAGHEWAASVSSRSAGAGCPDCSRDTPTTTLLAGHPGLAAQWDTTANGALTDAVTSGSARRVGWCCSRGHRWTARVYSRTRGTGCPSCAGQLATPEDNLPARYPQLMGEWACDLNGNLDPATIRPKSSRRVWWRCTRDPDHVWQVRVADRAGRATGCPYCTRTRATPTAAGTSPSPTPASEGEKQRSFGAAGGHALPADSTAYTPARRAGPRTTGRDPVADRFSPTVLVGRRCQQQGLDLSRFRR